MWRWGLLLFCFSFVGAAAPTFHVPELTGPVVDDAGILSATAAAQITDYIYNLKQAGGTQIQVVTVPDLGGVAVEEASIKIAEAWKIGTKGKDDGVILLLANAEHKLRIEVGKGREGDLPDIVASRIIRETIVPRMRAHDVDGAIAAGVAAIAQKTDPALAGEAPTQHFRRADENATPFSRARPIHLGMIILIIIILRLLFGSGGGRGGGGWYDGGGGWGLGGGGGSGGGSSWGGGGGGFSGGGASGDW